MNEFDQQSINPLIREGTPPGTSVILQVNHNLSKILMLELERLIKNNSILNLAAWRALGCLSQLGDSSQKAMIQFARVDQAQMSRALALLEKKKFVSSKQCEQDKRSRVFAITSEGERYRKQLLPIVNEFHQRLNHSLTKEETDLYIKLSSKVAKAADQC